MTFGEHVLAETNAFELHLTEQSELSGLPHPVIDAAATLAAEKDKEGWIFTLHYPSYIPFMTYADNRELRKRMSLAFGRKGFQANDHNNEEIVKQIAGLRHERALLLGYDNHAHFVLEERMAERPETVTSFLSDLMEKAKPAALKEYEELSALAKEMDGIDKLEKWDGAYYSEKLKQRRFDLDEEQLKPYFQLDKVLNGVFTVAHKLFGLNFETARDVEVYHEDVTVYRVTDQEEVFVAYLYTDFHPRPGKQGGAWMTSYKPQYQLDGRNERPHISIVCNFTRPTANTPSLLTFREVTTLFHEFGHALHGMLANTTYSSLSGTNVYWDFVELPSQILENWCYEQETLQLFATHYKTGELIPMDLVEKIKQTATFLEGMQTLRQISFGLLDMAWHGADPGAVSSVKDFEEQAFKSTKLYPSTPQTCMSTSFAHIFQGGYAAGYYSYKWAEVLDADAFSYFQQEGVFNPKVAKRFKDTILSQGGTIDPMDLYIQFRGKKPDPEALLKRAGLLN